MQIRHTLTTRNVSISVVTVGGVIAVATTLAVLFYGRYLGYLSSRIMSFIGDFIIMAGVLLYSPSYRDRSVGVLSILAIVVGLLTVLVGVFVFRLYFHYIQLGINPSAVNEVRGILLIYGALNIVYVVVFSAALIVFGLRVRSTLIICSGVLYVLSLLIFYVIIFLMPYFVNFFAVGTKPIVEIFREYVHTCNVIKGILRILSYCVLVGGSVSILLRKR